MEDDTQSFSNVGSVASVNDPTDLERAALREFCTCEKVLMQLKKRVQEKTKPLLMEASEMRNSLIQELREVPCAVMNGSYFRVVSRATTRAITPALVTEVVEHLHEDQIQLNAISKGKPIERKLCIEKTVLSAIRSARTSHHDGLLVSAEPLKTVKAVPIPQSARQHAAKLLECREDIALKRRNGKEARAETETRKSFASSTALEYLKRINAEKPINVTVDYAESEENDKFRVKILKSTKKVTQVSAKAFADIVADCVQRADLESAEWRKELAASIVSDMSNLKREAEPTLSLRATLKRKREEEEEEEEEEEQDEEEEEEEEY
jgi:hypothetical protein